MQQQHGRLAVRLEHIASGRLPDVDKQLGGAGAVVGALWSGQRRAFQLDADNGLPVKWDHLVTFKVTKAMAKTMKDCPPVEVKLLKFPAYVAGNQIASGFLDVDAYLWQEGPISARVLLADTLDQPVLELATSCHYEPPTGCRYMASRSPTKGQITSAKTDTSGHPPLPKIYIRSTGLPKTSSTPPVSGPTPVYRYGPIGPELNAPTSAFASLAHQVAPSHARVKRSESMDHPAMVGLFGKGMQQLKSQFLRETVSDLTAP